MEPTMRAKTHPTLMLMLLLLLGLSLNTGCLIISTGGDHPPCDEHNGEDCEHDGDWGDDDWHDGRDDRDDKDDDKNDDDDNCSEPGDVCGEDGETYGSACAASRAHVRVDYQGACGQACSANAECELGELCGADSSRCEVASCPEVLQPVCGADGVTYDNDCLAQSQHIDVVAQGECAPSCLADADCADGSICEQGFCAEANCPALDPEDYSQEVCGDDGFTYKTECEARVSRIDVAHQGCCI